MLNLKKAYSAEQFVRDYDLLLCGARILNAGSSSTRFGENCVNVDIQEKPGVDLVADLHKLPDDIEPFDAIICNAVLQYCKEPTVVLEEFCRVLAPGGLLFIEAPWVQPYCHDTDDLYRFSELGLTQLLGNFDVLKSGPTITPGSAFVMQGSFIAGTVSTNKYVSFALSKLTETVLFPFHWVTTKHPSRTAGAHYAIARNTREATNLEPASLVSDNA